MLIRLLCLKLLKILLYFVLLSCLMMILFIKLPIPTSSFILQSTLSAENSNTQYHWVDYDQISDNLKMAVIASEDATFLSHSGFNLKAMKAAYSFNKQSKRTARGGSTISQQLAKNLFLWSGKSYTRKIIEAYFTFLIEIFWSKERILEVYLNVVQFDKGVFGVEAASRRYYKISAKSLDAYSAARLVVLLPQPIAQRFFHPDKKTRKKILRIQKSIPIKGFKRLK
ncbi:MAG: monofunctional biosynthetic peptidoglycan transglycosylase [Oceanospirillaceae bacterium]|nr:monofunctional biosynthetic peptidoglycan transglycosylase [Oceanospirillaceae bacterium]